MTPVKPMARRLSRDEFADALRKGLGRALLHVLCHGLDDVADLVLEGCLHLQVYDPQCEFSRADWLFRMYRDSRHYPAFARALRDLAEGESEIEVNEGDVQQVCELLKFMAIEGDAAARVALIGLVRELAAQESSDETLGESDWLELDGREALLELARIYGQRLRRNPLDRVPDGLIYAEIPGHTVKEVLLESARTDADVKVYWDYLEAHGAFEPGPGYALGSPRVRALLERFDIGSEDGILQAKQRQWVRQRYSVETVLEGAQGKGPEDLAHYATFGRHATPDELKQIYTHLLNETNESVQARLLWVFRRARLPELDDRLFGWAVGSHVALRHASIAALSHSTDERVHKLARWKASAGELSGPDQEALGLFLNNYTRDDADLIAQSLRSLAPDPGDAHSLIRDLADLAEKQRDAALAEALKWGYENTPCTNCRYELVKQLSLVGQLDEQLRYECEFDAAEEIRAFAQSLPVTGFQPTEPSELGKLSDRSN